MSAYTSPLGIMIGLISFFLSCMVGADDVATGGKRKDRSPLIKLNVKKSKALGDEEIGVKGPYS